MIFVFRNSSTPRGNILTKSQPIFKNYLRSRTAKEFLAILDFAGLSSYLRLEVMNKIMTAVLSTNHKSVRRGSFPEYIKKSILINALPHANCIRVAVGPHKYLFYNLIQKQSSLAHF